MKFLSALTFLTIVRLPARSASPEELGRSLVYFPIVGAIIGLSLAGLKWGLSQALPPAVTSVLLVGWLTIASGGLHLDGLADTCDGVGGQKSREARLEVMRDSRVGGFGVIGITLVLLAKFAALSAIHDILPLILVPVISRWAMVYAIFAHPYARPAGLGQVFKEHARGQDFFTATLLALAIAMVTMGGGRGWHSYLGGLAIMAGVWVIIAGVAAYLRNKIGGLTGDSYGAINEVAEVIALILVSLFAYNRWLGLS